MTDLLAILVRRNQCLLENFIFPDRSPTPPFYIYLSQLHLEHHNVSVKRRPTSSVSSTLMA